MVVKNVAGLDMGKLMIGSFGTLGVLTTVNFRLHSLPPETRTFLFAFSDLEAAIEKRNSVIGSSLQPFAMDLISPAASARFGHRSFLLAIRAGGTSAVLKRYGSALHGSSQLCGDQDVAFWQQVREFTPDFLGRQPGGVVLRVSTTLTDTRNLLRISSGPSISRAASGVTYVYLSSWQSVPPFWSAAAQYGWGLAVEFSPDEIRNSNELWLAPSSAARSNSFAMMEKVKRMFDPKKLLNRDRLYGRI
jgi:glycolate oxidase FAD binding subunit